MKLIKIISFAEPKICTDFEYTCSDSTCINKNKLCDCNPDCSDSSDEINCPPAPNKFRCLGDGRCIESWRKCDGISDCLDGSDEINCPGWFIDT